MQARIVLKTNFSFSGSDSGDWQLPSGVITIGDILRYIGQQINFPFIAADSVDLRPDIEVKINGKDVWFHPKGINTPLKHGDSVEVYLVPLGGG